MTTEAEITCLCGQLRDTVLLETGLPIRSTVCHCNSCRWTTGTLFQSLVPIAEPPPSQQVQLLTRYDPTPNASRYFCNECGSHIYRKNYRDGSWYVSAAVVDRLSKSEQVSSCRLQRIAEHHFVADTVDGGLAVCLAASLESPAIFRSKGAGSEAVSPVSRTTLPMPSAHDSSRSRLRATCHCGGVDFFLSRPDKASQACSSPWPDLLRPYHCSNPSNPTDEKWWLRGPDKFFAGTCACRTCRLSNSTSITTWAFVPKVNLSKPDGSPIDFNMGTLQGYQSSEDTVREFCRICGASVFWHSEVRPDLLDVSIGLLRADEGARAGTWLHWCVDRVSFAEEAFDADLIADCASGLARLNA